MWTYRHFLQSTFDVLPDSGQLVRAGCFGEGLARQIIHVMDDMLDEPEEGRVIKYNVINFITIFLYF